MEKIKNEELKKIVKTIKNSPAYSDDAMDIVLLATDEKTDTSHIVAHCSPDGFGSLLVNLGEKDEDLKRAIVMAAAQLL